MDGCRLDACNRDVHRHIYAVANYIRLFHNNELN